ncbi:MAG: DUF3267 domain-containing protein [Defluviitaleaceae bacterium]|nr:DUF3267 domain-containing protein [Defluviitaleaceae bacterium]MCL2274676.1 DUF3267 domain-containing protein [Defluviitaleaceae bacterium]MCL2275763.1 DUF3267 domain-containing protein [Defluviitaleaceae bacterium]
MNLQTPKPIIPNISTGCFTRGYNFGVAHTFLFVLLTMMIDGVTAVQVTAAWVHMLFGENLHLTIEIPVTVISGLGLFFAIIIVHELLHILCFPRFWAKGNLQIIMTFNKGIMVNNRGVTMTKLRTIFCAAFPFLVLSVGLLVISIYTTSRIFTSFLRLIVLLNFLASSFDLRTIFYLLKLPKNALIIDGNYILK